MDIICEKAGTDGPRPFDAIDAVDQVGLPPSRLRGGSARFRRFRRGVDCVDVRPDFGGVFPPVDDIDDADDVDEPRTEGRRREVRPESGRPGRARSPRRSRRTTRRRADGTTRNRATLSEGSGRRLPSSCRPVVVSGNGSRASIKCEMSGLSARRVFRIRVLGVVSGYVIHET